MNFPALRRLPRLAAALVGTVGLLVGAPASATLFTQDFAPETIALGGADFTFDFTTPVDITSDAILTLTLDGDLNANSEFATVYVDGIQLGAGGILDGNPLNDPFNFADGDDADSRSADGEPVTGSAVLTAAFLSPLLADGTLSLFIDTNDNVDSSPTTVSASLSYNFAEPAVVPEPSTLSLAGLLLAVGGLARRRARRA